MYNTSQYNTVQYNASGDKRAMSSILQAAAQTSVSGKSFRFSREVSAEIWAFDESLSSWSGDTTFGYVRVSTAYSSDGTSIEANSPLYESVDSLFSLELFMSELVEMETSSDIIVLVQKVALSPSITMTATTELLVAVKTVVKTVSSIELEPVGVLLVQGSSLARSPPIEETSLGEMSIVGLTSRQEEIELTSQGNLLVSSNKTLVFSEIEMTSLSETLVSGDKTLVFSEIEMISLSETLVSGEKIGLVFEVTSQLSVSGKALVSAEVEMAALSETLVSTRPVVSQDILMTATSETSVSGGTWVPIPNVLKVVSTFSISGRSIRFSQRGNISEFWTFDESLDPFYYQWTDTVFDYVRESVAYNSEGVLVEANSPVYEDFDPPLSLYPWNSKIFAYVRESVAYNSEGVLVEANSPVYEDVDSLFSFELVKVKASYELPVSAKSIRSQEAEMDATSETIVSGRTSIGKQAELVGISQISVSGVRVAKAQLSLQATGQTLVADRKAQGTGSSHMIYITLSTVQGKKITSGSAAMTASGQTVTKFSRNPFVTIRYLRGRLHGGIDRQDFEVWSGDDKILRYTIEDVATVDPSTAIWAASRSVRSNKLIRISDGLVIGNQVDIELRAINTEDLRRGRYYHELELTDSEGRISTVAIGVMEVKSTLIKKPEEGV